MTNPACFLVKLAGCTLLIKYFTNKDPDKICLIGEKLSCLWTAAFPHVSTDMDISQLAFKDYASYSYSLPKLKSWAWEITHVISGLLYR